MGLAAIYVENEFVAATKSLVISVVTIFIVMITTS
jgi:hypothetical protein